LRVALNIKLDNIARQWCLTLVILATWETESWRIAVPG
jgi:hypothetical protein